MNPKIEKLLNEQIKNEQSSSQFYLAMASWAENKGLNGTATFLYQHSDEERMHMLKLVKFINERGDVSVIPAVDKPKVNFSSLMDLFVSLLEHEVFVTKCINDIVGACLEERDYITHNFVQWFVSEQMEEEALARKVIDKLKIIGKDNGGLYQFDSEMAKYQDTTDNNQNL